MSISRQSRLSIFGNKNQEVDIPDFLKRPQETRRIISETVLQEFIQHEYHKGIITGWAYGFLTGILILLIIEAILITLGIISISYTSYLQNQLFVV